MTEIDAKRGQKPQLLISLRFGLWPSESDTSEIIGCFRTPRRKRRIRENQSTATVPVLKRPLDQFAVSQLLDGNVCVYARVVCMLGQARGRITRALIGWLPFYCPYVLSLHRTLIWPSNVVYFSGTGEFSDLRRPPAEISVLSFFRRACENRLPTWGGGGENSSGDFLKREISKVIKRGEQSPIIFIWSDFH